MEMVNAGTYPITLMQNKNAEFWAQVFPNAKPRTDLTLAQDVELGWAIQKGTPQLKAELDEILDLGFADDVLAWSLEPDGDWRKIPTVRGLESHVGFQELALARAKTRSSDG